MTPPDFGLPGGLSLSFEKPTESDWRLTEPIPADTLVEPGPADRRPETEATPFLQAGRDAPTCLLRPLHYESGYGYPLIVWLHDRGADERSIRRMMPEISMRNFAGVAVRGTARHETGYDWPAAAEARVTAGQRVEMCIQLAAQTLNIREDRIFLAGAGVGGTLALELAFAAPQRFAGVASIGGPTPQGSPWLSRLSDARGLPVLLAGPEESDDDLAVQAYRADQRLLYAAGAELKTVACDSRDIRPVLAEVNRWAMAAMGACC